VFTTVLVILGTVLCIRLGIWQLDRLDQRRTFNAHVEAMWAAPAITLPEEMGDFHLETMEYRSVQAQGEYDFSSQVVLRNQYNEDEYGYHLLTPLVIGEGIAVIVDRGWIPAEGNDHPDDWRIYDTEFIYVNLSGIVRQGQDRPDIGGRPDPTLGPNQNGLDFWNNVNLDRFTDQMSYQLLNVYIQLDPKDEKKSPPIPFQPEIELSEGPHLGYAGQWFTFAAILFFGYPVFIRKRENL
jgi:surfeit locus 1 family protein